MYRQRIFVALHSFCIGAKRPSDSNLPVAMLEYLAYKKYKARKDKARADESQLPNGTDSEVESGQPYMLALDRRDEDFLESSLTSSRSPSGLLAGIGSRVRRIRSTMAREHTSTPLEKAQKEEQLAERRPPGHSIIGQGRPDDADSYDLNESDPIADVNTQRTQIQKMLDAFNMNLRTDATSSSTTQTFSQRARDQFAVSTINTKTKELLDDFMQVLKDIQTGAPMAGHDLQDFFERHTRDLKSANDSVPSFIKTLILKLLPISTIPSLEELSKPGALMGLIKGVLQILKGRFPAFVSGSVLMVMAVVIVMLGIWYAFKRGREERELRENPQSSHVSESGIPGAGQQGRQVEISVDGVRYVTVLDEDGMRVPVPEDDRGVYWDRSSSSLNNSFSK